MLDFKENLGSTVNLSCVYLDFIYEKSDILMLSLASFNYTNP